MMVGAAVISETSVNFCHTTRRYNPTDSHLHARRREDLKSYLARRGFMCFLLSSFIHILGQYLRRRHVNSMEWSTS